MNGEDTCFYLFILTEKCVILKLPLLYLGKIVRSFISGVNWKFWRSNRP